MRRPSFDICSKDQHTLCTDKPEKMNTIGKWVSSRIMMVLVVIKKHGQMWRDVLYWIRAMYLSAKPTTSASSRSYDRRSSNTITVADNHRQNSCSTKRELCTMTAKDCFCGNNRCQNWNVENRNRCYVNNLRFVVLLLLCSAIAISGKRFDLSGVSLLQKYQESADNGNSDSYLVRFEDNPNGNHAHPEKDSEKFLSFEEDQGESISTRVGSFSSGQRASQRVRTRARRRLTSLQPQSNNIDSTASSTQTSKVSSTSNFQRYITTTIEDRTVAPSTGSSQTELSYTSRSLEQLDSKGENNIASSTPTSVTAIKMEPTLEPTAVNSFGFNTMEPTFMDTASTVEILIPTFEQTKTPTITGRDDVFVTMIPTGPSSLWGTETIQPITVTSTSTTYYPSSENNDDNVGTDGNDDDHDTKIPTLETTQSQLENPSLSGQATPEPTTMPQQRHSPDKPIVEANPSLLGQIQLEEEGEIVELTPTRSPTVARKQEQVEGNNKIDTSTKTNPNPTPSSSSSKKNPTLAPMILSPTSSSEIQNDTPDEATPTLTNAPVMAPAVLSPQIEHNNNGNSAEQHTPQQQSETFELNVTGQGNQSNVPIAGNDDDIYLGIWNIVLLLDFTITVQSTPTHVAQETHTNSTISKTSIASRSTNSDKDANGNNDHIVRSLLGSELVHDSINLTSLEWILELYMQETIVTTCANQPEVGLTLYNSKTTSLINRTDVDSTSNTTPASLATQSSIIENGNFADDSDGEIRLTEVKFTRTKVTFVDDNCTLQPYKLYLEQDRILQDLTSVQEYFDLYVTDLRLIDNTTTITVIQIQLDWKACDASTDCNASNETKPNTDSGSSSWKEQHLPLFWSLTIIGGTFLALLLGFCFFRFWYCCRGHSIRKHQRGLKSPWSVAHDNCGDDDYNKSNYMNDNNKDAVLHNERSGSDRDSRHEHSNCQTEKIEVSTIAPGSTGILGYETFVPSTIQSRIAVPSTNVGNHQNQHQQTIRQKECSSNDSAVTSADAADPLLMMFLTTTAKIKTPDYNSPECENNDDSTMSSITCFYNNGTQEKQDHRNQQQLPIDSLLLTANFEGVHCGDVPLPNFQTPSINVLDKIEEHLQVIDANDFEYQFDNGYEMEMDGRSHDDIQ